MQRCSGECGPADTIGASSCPILVDRDPRRSMGGRIRFTKKPFGYRGTGDFSRILLFSEP